MTMTYPLTLTVPTAAGASPTATTPKTYSIRTNKVSIDFANEVLRIPILKGSTRLANGEAPVIKLVDMGKKATNLTIDGHMEANVGLTAFETARDLHLRLGTSNCTVQGTSGLLSGNNRMVYRGITYDGAVLSFKYDDDSKYSQDTTMSGNKISRTIPVSFKFLVTKISTWPG